MDLISKASDSRGCTFFSNHFSNVLISYYFTIYFLSHLVWIGLSKKNVTLNICASIKIEDF